MRANSWQDVADASAAFGIELDGWQELILEAAMGERSDRTWAAKRVGISVPRQNGKSQLLVARALAGALLFGEKKIVVSAHQQDTARESFAKLMEIVEDEANESLRGRVKSVMNALNREAVKFTNGATIQFKARSGAAGKGFSSDCLLLDEAQILGSRAWTSINSTMSAMRNPQVWLLGTPPQDEDDCYAFEMVRKAAVEGKSSASAWCEWSVDVQSDEYREARTDLVERRWSSAVEYLCWAANPAWSTRINMEVVQGEFETYSPDRFAQDRHGIWRSEAQASLFPAWSSLRADPPASPLPLSLGVACDRDQTMLTLGAVVDGTEKPHLAVVDRRPATERKEFAANIARIQRERGCEVLIRGRNFLIPDLEDHGAALRLVDSVSRAEAHTNLATAIEAAEVEHGDYPELNAAVALAAWKVTDTGRSFDGRVGDISALDAVALALHGAERAVNYDPLSSVLL